MALSGHRTALNSCPLSEVKRTLIGHATMTSSGGKAELPAFAFRLFREIIEHVSGPA
jgi:hypothetical protein